MANAAEQRGDEPRLAAAALRVVDVGADARKALEVLPDEGRGLGLRNAEPHGEPEARNAVDDAAVDGLGAPPEIGIDLRHRHAEHGRGGGGVNVKPFGEGFAQLRNVGEVGEQPQFDLAVMGRDNLLAGLLYEGSTDLAT